MLVFRLFVVSFRNSFPNERRRRCFVTVRTVKTWKTHIHGVPRLYYYRLVYFIRLYYTLVIDCHCATCTNAIKSLYYTPLYILLRCDGGESLRFNKSIMSYMLLYRVRRRPRRVFLENAARSFPAWCLGRVAPNSQKLFNGVVRFAITS